MISKTRSPKRFVFAALAALVAASSALAVIQRTIPLRDVIAAESWIFVAEVASIDSSANTVVLKLVRSLKGHPPRKELAILLYGDDKARQEQQKSQLLERLESGLRLILFGSQRGTKTTLFAYTNGTWFQIVGEPHKGESILFNFTHFEPYLRRTYKGATAEFERIVTDTLAGKKAPPPPEPKEPPGIGPPLKK